MAITNVVIFWRASQSKNWVHLANYTRTTNMDSINNNTSLLCECFKSHQEKISNAYFVCWVFSLPSIQKKQTRKKLIKPLNNRTGK